MGWFSKYFVLDISTNRPGPGCMYICVLPVDPVYCSLNSHRTIKLNILLCSFAIYCRIKLNSTGFVKKQID